MSIEYSNRFAYVFSFYLYERDEDKKYCSIAMMYF